MSEGIGVDAGEGMKIEVGKYEIEFKGVKLWLTEFPIAAMGTQVIVSDEINEIVAVCVVDEDGSVEWKFPIMWLVGLDRPRYRKLGELIADVLLTEVEPCRT